MAKNFGLKVSGPDVQDDDDGNSASCFDLSPDGDGFRIVDGPRLLVHFHRHAGNGARRYGFDLELDWERSIDEIDYVARDSAGNVLATKHRGPAKLTKVMGQFIKWIDQTEAALAAKSAASA